MTDHHTSPSAHREYWEQFYAGKRVSDIPAEPSAFARWAHDQMPPENPVAEIGCGNARDSLWFAQQGRRVRGYDYSSTVIEQCGEVARTRELPADFVVLDLYDRDAVLAAADAAAAVSPSTDVYARFLLHAVETDGQQNVAEFAARAVGEVGRLYCEWRTNKDRGTEHLFGEHYRSYPPPEEIFAMIESTGGRVLEHVEGHGFAIYKDEDPHVCRLVASWQD